MCHFEIESESSQYCKNGSIAHAETQSSVTPVRSHRIPSTLHSKQRELDLDLYITPPPPPAKRNLQKGGFADTMITSFYMIHVST